MPNISITDVRKAFDATQALDGVSIEIERGEVHALLGENGAGKSTLVKILSGVVVRDSGRVSIAGKPVAFGSPKAATRAGVATAFQELSLLPNLTVAQNLLLPDLPRGALGMVSAARVRRQAAEILERWDLTAVSPDASIGELSLAERQRVELVRAMNQQPELLILDEPTAALPETDWLFTHIEALSAAGTSVLYVSHRLAEVRRVCVRGTVLRNGRVAGVFTPGEFDENKIISMMIGRSLEVAFPSRTRAPNGRPMLHVEDLSAGTALQRINIDVKSGEIVGVAGLEGQGQRELFYALYGLIPYTAKTVEVDGKPRRIRNPRHALSAGLALVPEERKTEGLFPSRPARENLTLSILDQIARGGLIPARAERRRANEGALQLNLRREMLERTISHLSGGNQQKIVLGRMLTTGARCLLLFDPTRGIDPGTKLEVYALIRDFAHDDGAVLMYSTEIPELVGLCDRVYVLYGGRIVAEHAGDDLDEGNILSGAVGRARCA